MTAQTQHNRPVFILSSGRSGSTWLQKTLCTHPHLAIWGEHHGILEPLTNALRRMEEQERMKARINATPEAIEAITSPLADLKQQTAWTVPFDVAELRAATRRWILELFASRLPPATRWGFKEIRYSQRGLTEMLLGLFPEAKFIFLARETVAVLRSMVISWVGRDWRAKTDDELSRYIDERAAFMQRQRAAFAPFIETHGSSCLVLTYEDMLSDFHSTMARVFEFVEEDIQLIPAETLEAANSTVTWPTPEDDELVRLIRTRLPT